MSVRLRVSVCFCARERGRELAESGQAELMNVCNYNERFHSKVSKVSIMWWSLPVLWWPFPTNELLNFCLSLSASKVKEFVRTVASPIAMFHSIHRHMPI